MTTSTPERIRATVHEAYGAVGGRPAIFDMVAFGALPAHEVVASESIEGVKPFDWIAR